MDHCVECKSDLNTNSRNDIACNKMVALIGKRAYERLRCRYRFRSNRDELVCRCADCGLEFRGRIGATTK